MPNKYPFTDYSINREIFSDLLQYNFRLIESEVVPKTRKRKQKEKSAEKAKFVFKIV